jgi:hypothetical protein
MEVHRLVDCLLVECLLVDCLLVACPLARCLPVLRHRVAPSGRREAALLRIYLIRLPNRHCLPMRRSPHRILAISTARGITKRCCSFR